MKIVITGVDGAGKSTALEIREATEAVDAWKTRLSDIPDWVVGTEKLMSFEPDPGWVKSFAVSIPPAAEGDVPQEGHHAENGSDDDVGAGAGRELREAHAAGLHKTLTCEVVFSFDPIVLRLETCEVELEAGDMVVIRGVLHDWRNPTNRPARVGGVSWAVRR